MESLGNLALGFATIANWHSLAYCFAGVFIGTFIGVLPGVGPIAAISLLLPITYYLDPTTALVLLAGVYYGAEYGGSTASILLNLPGTASNAVTCLDGYPMSQQGRAGVALFTTSVASFIGGSIGIVIMTFAAPALAEYATAFGPSDYFAVVTLGLIGAASVAQGSPVKGVAMVVLGVLLGCVGTDVNTGRERYTLGLDTLTDGINLIALAMGLFGITEIIASLTRADARAPSQGVSLRSMVPTRDDVRRSALPVLRGTGIGSVLGALPGTGPALAAFMSYALEKRLARDPSRFGRGAIEGIASPEASNNAAVQTAFIPTLTLGIPGTATMAMMLGALMIQGINPGPNMIAQRPEIFWGLVASFWVGNVFLLILNIPLIGIWVRLLRVPYRFLYPIIIVLICLGVYSVHNLSSDILQVFGVAVFGYVLRLAGFSPAPLLIGFILGPMLEEHLRRGLMISRGSYVDFFSRPLTAALTIVALLMLLAIAAGAVRNARLRRPRQTDGQEKQVP